MKKAGYTRGSGCGGAWRRRPALAAVAAFAAMAISAPRRGPPSAMPPADAAHAADGPPSGSSSTSGAASATTRRTGPAASPSTPCSRRADVRRREGVGRSGDASSAAASCRRRTSRSRPRPRSTSRSRGSKATLDSVAKTHPNPGNVVVHRLNRTEYQREIKNLLDLDIDAAALLPKDTKADGFDNVATVLKVSPSFLDAYIVAASEVSTRAMGNAKAGPSSTTYRSSPGTPQDSHIDGMPLGTRGGLHRRTPVPADGDYIVQHQPERRWWRRIRRGPRYAPQDDHDARRQEGLRAGSRRRGRPQVRRSEAGAGGEGHPRSLRQHQASRAGGPAQDRRHVRRALVCAGRRPAASRWAARADLPRVPLVFEPRGRRAREGHGHQRHAEPQEDLRLLSEERGGRSAVREADRQQLRAPTRSVARSRTPISLRRCSFYENGPRGEGLRSRRPAGRDGHPREPEVPVSRRRRSRRMRSRARSITISDVELASRLSFFLWSQGPDKELLDAADRRQAARRG